MNDVLGPYGKAPARSAVWLARFYGTDFVQRADFWVPEGTYGLVLADLLRSIWDSRRALGFAAVGRLKPGLSLDQGQAALTSLAGQLAREYPTANRRRGVALVPLSQALISPNNRQTYVRASGDSACATS